MSTLIAPNTQSRSTGCGCGCGGTLSPTCSCGSACALLGSPERPRFFDGQLLTQAELNGEQTYVMDKNRLHNRYLHGWGVVCGLRVSCCDATRVTVEAGYALDPCGNDIVLAQAQTLDLVQLVRDCRNQAKGSTDCNPFLTSQLADCTGIDQTWCLTISYAEQDARPVAALRGMSMASPSACGCSCNGNGSGSSTVATASATLDTVGRTATACEPTRTVETVSFGVACMPDATTVTTTATSHLQEVLNARQTLADRLPAGTFAGETLRCQAALLLVIEERPTFGNVDAQTAYTATCRWLKQAQSALAAHPTTRCWLAGDFGAVAVRAPNAGEDATTYAESVLTPAVLDVQQTLEAAAQECLCWNLIPGCPDPPADSCVVLACVTLRNDTIVDICMGWPRRQVATFPALEYWLTGLGSEMLDQLPTLLSPKAFGTALTETCCGADTREAQVPDTPEAGRFYALADLSATAPKISGLTATEFQRLRTSATSLRTLAVNALKLMR